VSDWGSWGSWEPPTPADDGPHAAEEERHTPSEVDDGDFGWGDYPEWPISRPTSEYPAYGQLPAHQAESVQPAPARHSHDPLGRLFPGLSRGARVTLDWVLTIGGAILIVLAVKSWVVNPYRIPSSSMEPYLNCAKPGEGCLGNSSDRVLACRICLTFSNPSRNDVIVFNTPKAAVNACGEGGTFVKRVIGLPGETVREDKKGFIWIRGPNSRTWVKLDEPFISAAARRSDVELNSGFLNHRWKVPAGDYFMMGDNRGYSCDSRRWGPVPRSDLIGTVFFTYWPPDRIGFK
jgi:signal peptidase I